MRKALEGIRAKIGAENCARSCSRDHCRVFLRDVPRSRVVVDMGKAFEAHGGKSKRYDFIVFLPGADGDLVAAPIELESGGVDVSNELDQLQEGAAFAQRFPPEAVCRPILFHGGTIIAKTGTSSIGRKSGFGELISPSRRNVAINPGI